MKYTEREVPPSMPSGDASPPTLAVPVRKIGNRDSSVVDRVAVEAPLELRFGPRSATVLMRTPGNDEDLVRGFLFTEGLIGSATDVRSLTRPPDLEAGAKGNVIVAELASGVAQPALERTFYSSSSCGVCGKSSIESLEIRAPRVTSELRIPRGVIGALPERMRAAQATFSETGGLHASALFDAEGTLLALREDVGRHNALDKIVGWALERGLVPLSRHVLLVSGRTSFEIVQKSVVAGIPVIAAVGAPSSMAVELAGRFGVTLLGFVRRESMNVYSLPERIMG